MGGSGKKHTLSRSARFEEACITGCPDGYTLKFDPRTELLFLVLANVVAFTQHSLWVEITWVVLLLLLIIACGCIKAAGRLAFAFGFCLLLQYYVFPNGPSGNGKTTICNLIARFYDVQADSIRMGGHDVREFTCDSLLKNMSMVFQNVYLFHDSIRNNIRFGRPDATEEEVIAAAKAARCHDFIVSLPQGYDTVVGEGGGTLSGGEKQRISIARAMLKNAPVIILDVNWGKGYVPVLCVYSKEYIIGSWYEGKHFVTTFFIKSAGICCMTSL